MAYRTERLAEIIKNEISAILRSEVKDPRVGFVTVTDVEVSGDKRHAKIFFSVMGDKQDRQATSKALNSANGFIRNALGQRLTLRYTPELEFRLDESLDHGIKIQEILHQVHSEYPEAPTAEQEQNDLGETGEQE